MSSKGNASTRIVFVRHGQSDYNDQARFQGSSNEPRLTSKGWSTAVRCGHYLSTVKFDAILCSPLRRADETAKAICAAFLDAGHSLPPLTYDNHLCEIHLPGWEGLPFATVHRRDPVLFRTWKESPQMLELPVSASSEDGCVEMFSPLRDMYDRSRNFLADTLESHPGQTILVVGHGAAISVAMSAAMGQTDANPHRLQQSNGGISAVEISAKAPNQARLLFVNQTQHLGELLPKIKEGRNGVRILLLTHATANQSPWNAFARIRPLDTLNSMNSIGLTADDFRLTAPDEVNTLVWVMPDGCLGRRELGSLWMDIGYESGLRLETGVITVLHYPRVNETPILQAMNVPAWRNVCLSL